MGPSNCNLHPENDLAKKLVEETCGGIGAASLLAGGAGGRSTVSQRGGGWDSYNDWTQPRATLLYSCHVMK